MAVARHIYHLVPTLITKLVLVPMKIVLQKNVSVPLFSVFMYPSFFLKLLFIKHFKLFYPNFSGINKQKENMHASRSYEELNDVCFEGFLTLGGGKKDNSQKFNSLRNAGQVNPFLHLGLNI